MTLLFLFSTTISHFLGSKIQKGEKKLVISDVDNPNPSFDLSGETFLRPSKRISPTVNRSMSLETQLSEIDSEGLKDRKGLKMLSTKRKSRKSCDETILSKVPKVILEFTMIQFSL